MVVLRCWPVQANVEETQRDGILFIGEARDSPGGTPGTDSQALGVAGLRLGPSWALVKLWELSTVLNFICQVRGLQPVLPSQPRKNPRPLHLYLGLRLGGKST